MRYTIVMRNIGCLPGILDVSNGNLVQMIVVSINAQDKSEQSK